MKKIVCNTLILIILLLGFTNLYGQDALNKGVYSIAGSVQYSSTNQNFGGYTYTTNIGNISPQFTYFILNHLSIGANVNYNYFYSKGPEGNNFNQVDKTTSLTLGPVIRFYFGVKKINPFIEASYNYSVEQTGMGDLGNQYGNEYGLKGGLEIFISRSVALEPSIGYTHLHYAMSSLNFSGDINNFSVGIGVNYFIF